MAEWFKALVLKTSIRKYRKFESCPVRPDVNFLSEKESSAKKDIVKMKSGACPDFFFDYDKSAPLGLIWGCNISF